MSLTLRLMFAFLLSLCLLATGREGVFVGFVSNPVGRGSVSGTVSVVQLGFVRDVTGKQGNGHRCYIPASRDSHQYQFLWRSKQKSSRKSGCARRVQPRRVVCAALAVVVVAT